MDTGILLKSIKQKYQKITCDHKWKKIKTIYKKRYNGGDVDILYRCDKCNKEKIMIKQVIKVELEDL